MKFYSYCFICIVFLFVQTKLAQGQVCDTTSVCNCYTLGDLSPASIMLGHEHLKGTWRISYRYMNMMMKNNMTGTEKVTDESIFQNYIMSPQNMRMDMHMFMAMYGLSDRLSLMMMFNYNVLSMNMSMLPGTMHMSGGTMVMTTDSDNMNSTSSGISDTKLYASYALVKKKNHSVVLNGGISLPTGSIHVTSNNAIYNGARLPYMMQRGSGTIDLLPGVTYLMKKEKFSWSSQLTSVLRPLYNSVGYHLGNEFTLNNWIAYQWIPWLSTSARLESYTAGRIQGRDPEVYNVMEPDANTQNYGGKRISTYLGLNLYVRNGFLKNNRFSFEYGLPFYQNLNGPQLATKSNLYAGWLIVF